MRPGSMVVCRLWTIVGAIATVMMLSGAVQADPPQGKGGGPKVSQGQGHGNQGASQQGRGRGGEVERGRGRGGEVERGRGSGGGVSVNFVDNDRLVIRDYYRPMIASGHCPPGLAKKGNGCMPPGQAKKWAVGHPLPRDLVYYDLPPDLLLRLSPPPIGYRYARVGSDILMLAVGTGMVVSALSNLAQ